MRLLGWFSKLLISVLLISFLSIFTTAYIVDLYISRILEQWNIGDIIKPSINVEDYVSKLVNPSQIGDHNASDSMDDGEHPDADQTVNQDDPGLPVFSQQQVPDIDQETTLDGSQEGIQDGSQETTLDGSQKGTQDGARVGALDSAQEGTQENAQDGTQNDIQDTQKPSQTSTRPPISNGSELKETLVMSAQEFNNKRKKLTTEDKSAIFSIVITKLPQKELQNMSLLLEDGITEEELVDLLDVMNAYLEQEEVDKLIAILNKY